MSYKEQLTKLVDAVSAQGASDLHLSVGHRPIVRVSGMLVPLVNFPELAAKDTQGLISELMIAENESLFLKQRDLDFSYMTPAGLRFRGNAFYQQGVIGVALRLITAKIRNFKELNLPAILE